MQSGENVIKNLSQWSSLLQNIADQDIKLAAIPEDMAAAESQTFMSGSKFRGVAYKEDGGKKVVVAKTVDALGSRREALERISKDMDSVLSTTRSFIAAMF